MRAAFICVGAIVATGLFYAFLVKACQVDLRFCPGPVACQVWQ